MATIPFVVSPPAPSAPRNRAELKSAATGSFHVELIQPADLILHRDAWEALANNSLTPNCFYEPWMLLPALEHLAVPPSLVFAVVARRDPRNTASAPWCGLFPLHRERRWHGLPLRRLSLWQHPQCFLGTPLIDQRHARDALKAFFDWARRDRGGANIIEFGCVDGAGSFAQTLMDVIEEQVLVTYVDQAFNRAFLETGTEPEAYLRGSDLSASHRRELGRMRRRLAEQGKLESRVLQAGENPAPWIEGFLELEAAGWKGKEKTALHCDSAERAYFQAIARAAHERQRLMMLGMFLDGRPIALKCNFLAGKGAFAFKIAYDERLEKYSPGVQLELDHLAEAQRRPGLAWIDSCAKPRHFMIDRLWHERRTIQDVLISTGSWRGNLLLGTLPLLRAVKRSWRRP